MSHITIPQEERAAATSRTNLGFWTYLMTDCVLFASLFATYIVLQNNTFGGPDAKELFSLPFVLTETMILLTSSFVCGIAVVVARSKRKRQVLGLLSLTMLLGIAFLAMEIFEFYELVHEGNDWRRSGFLSAFFTLVGTHGLHITAGLLWALTLVIYIARRGLTEVATRRLFLFSMFWHFLDIIWIFIFTFVYLAGAI